MSIRSTVRAAAVLGAATSTLLASAAFASDTIFTDGDTGFASPNLAYGGSARDCATRGSAVPGALTVSYNGSDNAKHFAAGEALDVSFAPAPGVVVNLVNASNSVPSNWGSSQQDQFTIPFTTTVEPTSAGGKVEVTIAGRTSGYDAGAGAGNGKPSFQVTVNCSGGDAGGGPVDTTPPTVALSHTADGDNGWNKTAPVSVAVTTSDDVGVSSITCTDTYNGSATPIAVSSENTLSVSGDGIHDLLCVATDAANNDSAPGTDTVKIDTVNPGITFTGTTPAAGDGIDADGAAWFKQSVQLNWSCSDATSGPVEGTINATVTEEGKPSSRTGTCRDNAGNASSDMRGVNIDKTAPSLNISGPQAGSFDVCSLPSRPSFAPTDALSGVASHSDAWSPASAFGLGQQSIYTAEADDYATNHSQETRTYTASTYGSAFKGIEQPINSDGSSRFKLGSTVPVKFRMMCGTTSVSNVVANLWLNQGDSAPDPGVDEAVSTAASTTGSLFRYDATAQQYIFNLSTKLSTYTNPDGSVVKLSAGTWTLAIRFNDSTTRNVKIQLVK